MNERAIAVKLGSLFKIKIAVHRLAGRIAAKQMKKNKTIAYFISATSL